MAIQADGKIVVAGSTGGNFSIARYNTNGSLDNTFDGDGRLTSNFGVPDSIRSIALQPDGKIVAQGTLEIARYNANGSLDLTFNGSGKITAPFLTGAMALQSNGKLILSSKSSVMQIARYNNDGSPDKKFSWQ